MKSAVFCLVLLAAFAVLLVACDEGTKVTFENQTDAQVTVWRGSVEQTQLPPGESKAYTILYFPATTTFRVTDGEDDVLFEKTFTFDELEEFSDIVVTADSSSPSSP